MSGTPVFSHTVRIADLAKDQATEFRVEPDAGARAAIARALGLGALRKTRLSGRLMPIDRADWRLVAQLGRGRAWQGGHYPPSRRAFLHICRSQNASKGP